jgi:hypothetical protein
VGIVYGPSTTYVIAVFGEGADEGTLVNTIAQVSRMVYQQYD